MSLARFDHACLNEIAPFDVTSPTSENIARVIHDGLKEKLAAAAPGVRLAWLSVAESSDTEVVYRED